MSSEVLDEVGNMDGFRYLSEKEKEPTQLMNRLFAKAIREGASDVHIEDDQDNTCIRFRMDGVLREICRISKDFSMIFDTKIRNRSSLSPSERIRPLDGKFQVTVDGFPIDVRVSIVPSILGRSTVCRLLDSRNAKRHISAIPMPDLVRQELMAILSAESGMLLLTGPTGSGKTSTLYACLNHLNHVSTKLVTIEDPVEYQVERVQQLQVKDGVRFVDLLRSVLRQDPDVVLVGEIRDHETAEVSLGAANTGHLILSTLHANNSTATVKRLIDLGPDPYAVGQALKGVIAQRLVAKLCPHCRGVRHPTDLEKRLLTHHGFAPQLAYGFAVGCGHCDGTGVAGRMPVMEMLIVNGAIRHAMENQSPNELITAAQGQPQYRTLVCAALDLALAGTIDLTSALKLATDQAGVL